MAGFVVCVATQLAWGTAHLHGWQGPIFTYFRGWDDGLAALSHRPTDVVSLTGADPVPATFRGSSRLAEAGAVTTPPTRPLERRSRVLAVLTRLPFIVAFAALACTCLHHRLPRRLAVLLLAGGSLAAAEWSYRATTDQPHPFLVQQGMRIEPGQSATVTIRLAGDTKRRLAFHLEPEDRRGGLFLASSRPVAVQVSIGQRTIPLRSVDEHGVHEFARDQLLDALQSDESLVLTISNPGPDAAVIAGWQRRGVAGRALAGDADGLAIPAIELRVWDVRDGFLCFVAF
jgi:hypothetical protein